MLKKQSSTPNQGLSSRQVLVVLGATALAAIIIFIIFASLINRDSNNSNNQDYQNYLQGLQKQENTPASQANQPAPEVARQTVRGVLTVIGPERLTINAEDTNQKIELALLPETTITYQNQAFDRTRFFVGDQLEITARVEGGSLLAETITVLVSASPSTPAPLPPITPQNIRPDGTIKPL